MTEIRTKSKVEVLGALAHQLSDVEQLLDRARETAQRLLSHHSEMGKDDRDVMFLVVTCAKNALDDVSRARIIAGTIVPKPSKPAQHKPISET